MKKDSNIYFYDESEHSRKITTSTVFSDNFYHSFVTATIGIDVNNLEKIYASYRDFENKYKDRADKSGEIKSKVLGKPKHFKYGFVSNPKQNKDFILDYLKFIDDNDLTVYYSFENKFDLIIRQIFVDKLFMPFNYVYSLSKLITLYQPEAVIDSMLSSNFNIVSFFEVLFDFLKGIRKRDLSNMPLKHTEYAMCNMLLDELDSIRRNYDLSLFKFSLDWTYGRPFDGLYVHGCPLDSQIIIDHDGEDLVESLSVKSAKKLGFKCASSANSKAVIGLRIADIMVGLITQFTKAIHNNLVYTDLSDGINRKTLDSRWFKVSLIDHELYMYLNKILCKNNLNDKGMYPLFTSYYPDNMLNLLSLTNIISNIKGDVFVTNAQSDEYFDSLADDHINESVYNLQDYFNNNQNMK